MSKKESDDGFGSFLVVLIGIGYFCWDYLVNFVSKNWFWILIVVFGLIFLVSFLKYKINERKYQRLMNKYHDDDVVSGIMGNKVWRGQTAEQLFDSWGDPEVKDIKVSKYKRIEIWKYGRINKRSFKSKVTLENGIVVGYEV